MSEKNDNVNSVNRNDILEFVSHIVASYVSRNPVTSEQLPGLIRSVSQSLMDADAVADPGVEDDQKPAVAIKRSIQPDYLVCLEDGKKLKMLKRHLRTAHQMTPDQYRAKWNLPPDYPMVAPNYAAQRSDFAKQIGLGKSDGKAAPTRRKSR